MLLDFISAAMILPLFNLYRIQILFYTSRNYLEMQRCLINIIRNVM